MLVNGGKRIEPALIERIQDRHGRTVLRARRAAVSGMSGRRLDRSAGAAAARPARAGDRSRALVPDGQHAAGAWSSAARRRARWRSASRSPARPARPTTSGTPGSSVSRRTWWSGCYVGFDQPKTLGSEEQGASAALPIFVAVHGGGAQGRAGDAVPRAVRGAPGAGRCRYRAAGRPGHVDRDPRGVPARHRADRRQHGAAASPPPATRPASPRPRPASSARRPAACIERRLPLRRLSGCGQRAIGGRPNGAPDSRKR